MKIDVKGKLCPVPLIEVKKGLDKMAAGEKFEVELDNETAKDNVLRFLADSGCSPEVSGSPGLWSISAEKGQAAAATRPAEAYCIPQPSANPVVIFKSDKMGVGAEELGGILVKALVNTLKEIKPAPSTLVFYNSGVFLACGSSPLVGALKELESEGMRILVCGTCLDYYGLKADLKVGIVSNMFDILEVISKANPPIIP